MLHNGYYDDLFAALIGEGMTPREASTRALNEATRIGKREVSLDSITGTISRQRFGIDDSENTWKLEPVVQVRGSPGDEAKVKSIVTAMLAKIEAKNLTDKKKRRFRCLLLAFLKSESLDGCFDLFTDEELVFVKVPEAVLKSTTSKAGFSNRRKTSFREIARCSQMFYDDRSTADKAARKYRQDLIQILQGVLKEGDQ